MREYHILNLGAGVQSTALYLLSMQGRVQKFDAAIFADTQDEPGAEERRLGLPDPPESVYAHLDWLDSLSGPPILRRTGGFLSDDMIRGVNIDGNAYSCATPAYVGGDGQLGQTARQCTKNYKILVIERAIRRDVLGLPPRRAIPKGVIVWQYVGISWDERSRAFDVRRRFLDKRGREKPRNKVGFPLLQLNGVNVPGWTRTDCERYLEREVPHKVYGSSCIHCPYHDDQEWKRVLAMPASGPRLVQIDAALRDPGRIVNRNLDQKLYLHRSCVPIAQVQFKHERQMGFALECEGGCGL